VKRRSPTLIPNTAINQVNKTELIETMKIHALYLSTKTKMVNNLTDISDHIVLSHSEENNPRGISSFSSNEILIETEKIKGIISGKIL